MTFGRLNVPSVSNVLGVWTSIGISWYAAITGIHLSTLVMTQSAYAKSRPSQDTEIVYVTDNERDAEALQFQTDSQVTVRLRSVDTLVVTSSKVYVTQVLLERDVRDASDV